MEAPASETLALVVTAYLAGAVTPWYYAQERIRGFGRWVSNKVPYAPPPGEDPEKALAAAVEEGERSPDADEDAESEEGN